MNNDNVKRAIDRHLDNMSEEEQILVLKFIFNLEDFREAEAQI